MTINGKYYTEPELAAYVKELEAACKRYEDENRSLTDKLDEIGKAYNEQVSLAGWLEEKNAELEAERAALIKQLDEDIEEYSKSIYGDLYKGMQAGYMVLRSHLLREPESEGDRKKCDYYKTSDQ